MTIANPPKAFIALVALIALTILIAVHAIDSATGMPVITMVVGYSIGNGIAAKNGDPVDPILGPK